MQINFQIGDFGLSRDLDEENYYISNGGKIPVKWTAPEACVMEKSLTLRLATFMYVCMYVAPGSPLQEVLYSQ